MVIKFKSFSETLEGSKLRYPFLFTYSGLPSRRKRDAAPVVLFKAAQKKMAAKPVVKPTWESYGGRSFLSSDWKYDDGTDTQDEDELAADFFSFVDVHDKKVTFLIIGFHA